MVWRTLELAISGAGDVSDPASELDAESESDGSAGDPPPHAAATTAREVSDRSTTFGVRMRQFPDSGVCVPAVVPEYICVMHGNLDSSHAGAASWLLKPM